MKADLILALIIITASFIGYKRGFIKAFLNLFFVLFSALGCYLLYPYVADFISKTGLNKIVNDYILKTLTQKYIAAPDGDNVASLFLSIAANAY